MANDYFNFTQIAQHSPGLSSAINERFTAVQTGFSLLPTLSTFSTFNEDVAQVAADRAAIQALVKMLPADSVVATYADLPASPNTNDVAMIFADENAGGLTTLRKYDGADWDDVIYVSRPEFQSVAVMLAAPGTFSEGARIYVSNAEGAWTYEVLSSGAAAADVDLTRTGGGAEKLKCYPTVSGLDIRSFGALGDGTTNDAAAINAAYAAAANEGGTVVWPDGVYYTGTTKISCPAKVSTSASNGAKLLTDTTGVAMEVLGGSDIDDKGQIHDFPEIVRSSLGWNDSTETTSIGLQLADRKYDTFNIRQIRNFTKGLALKADTANFVCNTINLGMIRNNRISIDFSDVGGSWGINQNTFVGGACVIDGAYTTASGRIYLNMPDTENNGNTFVGVNLEKGGNEKAIVCAANSCTWLNCRFEGSASTADYITLSGNNCRIIGGAPASSATVPFVTWISDTGSGNVFWMSNVVANKYVAWDTHSGSRAIRLGNGTAYPASPIGAYGTNRISLGDSTVIGTRHHGLLQQEMPPQTTGATIPMANAVVLTYAAAETITGMVITGGTDTSALISICSTNGNATLEHTASPSANAGKFVLTGGANLTLTANTPVLFQLVGGNLYQI